MTSERDDLKAAFLARSGFGDARREPLSGDASTRSYERLHLPSGRSLIFMDQPPAAEETATRAESEHAQAQWLRRIPDDPGGLLKRKFYYQYRLRQQQQAE